MSSSQGTIMLFLTDGQKIDQGGPAAVMNELTAFRDVYQTQDA